MCSSPPQPEKTTRLLSFSESMVRVAPHAQTLTLLLAAGGLLWYSSESLAKSKADINLLNVLLNEKIENLRKEMKLEIESSRKEMKLEIESSRRENKLEIEKSQAESAKVAMGYQLKYQHSEEYISLRNPESSTAVISSSAKAPIP